MDGILIGIDLGATNVRIGAFTPGGERLAALSAAIEAERGPQAGLERIGDLAERVLRIAEQGAAERGQSGTAGLRIGEQFGAAAEGVPRPAPQRIQTTAAAVPRLAIGIGATGPTDSARGLILNPGTLPGWVDVPIAAYLSERFGAPARLENDADAAALGEYWTGAGRGASRMFMLTVGTGIGAALIVDGQVYRGAGGFHPEGGHLIVDPSGPPCYCGARGCLESWSSGTAIAAAARARLAAAQTGPDAARARLRRSASAPQPGAALLRLVNDQAGGDPAPVTARLVAEAARLGDPLAQQVIAQAAAKLALAIHSLIMLYQPELIVMGGGVMRSADLFLPALEAARQSAGGYVPVDGLRLVVAQLGGDAGMVGAAYAAMQVV